MKWTIITITRITIIIIVIRARFASNSMVIMVECVSFVFQG